MKYSGIDLQANNSMVTITDDEDRVVVEQRLPNELDKIVGLLKPCRDELVVWWWSPRTTGTSSLMVFRRPPSQFIWPTRRR
jgi:hypothetical protein